MAAPSPESARGHGEDNGEHGHVPCAPARRMEAAGGREEDQRDGGVFPGGSRTTASSEVELAGTV